MENNINAVYRAVRANFAILPDKETKLSRAREFRLEADENLEDSKVVAQAMFVGISAQKEISKRDVCSFLSIEPDKYEYQLRWFEGVIFNNMLLNIDDEFIDNQTKLYRIKRFKNKYRLCMNHIKFNAKSMFNTINFS